MYHLRRHKIIFVLLGLLLAFRASAQENDPLYDVKRPIRFGFSLGVTHANFKILRAEDFLDNDTLISIQPKPFVGLFLGPTMNVRLNRFFELRTEPIIIFNQRNVNFDFKNDAWDRSIKVETIQTSIPLILRFCAKKHKNTRFFVMGGVRYSYDFASQVDEQKSLVAPVLAQKKSTLAYEVGFGWDIYYPYFKFIPTVRIVNGIGNSLFHDGFMYSESIGVMQPRLIQFSFQFQ